MKTHFKVSKLKVSPVALYTLAYFAIIVLASTHGADASGKYTQSGALDLSAASSAIDTIISIATGPIAKFIAVIAVIGGAIGMAQGREMNEGLSKLGLVAFTVGAMIGLTNLFNSGVGAGI